MDPLDFKQDLPIQQDGPIKLPERATDTIEWAHHILKEELLMRQNGPIKFLERAADSIEWAHLTSRRSYR
jgi:hypothetical protein